jgi:GWxTD domain-containing protein
LDGFSDGSGSVVFQKFKKLSTKESEPLLLHLPIDDLPSGKFHVLVEIFDKDKTILSNRKVDFIRSNPDYDIEYWKSYNANEDNSFVSDFGKDEVNYALRAISAIVYEPRKSLMNFMIKEASLRAQKKFLFDFWKDKSPGAPELSYQKYMAVAKAIDLEYNNNVGYGFETDRGYIFLRYGKPNNVLSVDTEPDSYPYEIWYYNYLKETNQTNVRFIFYNKSLAHNDYSILHSTCVGERQNPAWEVELYSKAVDVLNSNTIDARTVADNWQRNARRYFNDY